MLGYPVNDLIGRTFVELVVAEDRTMVSARHNARLAGEKVPEQYDIRVATSRGTVICCSLNVGLSKNQDGITVAVGSVRDITQHKKALAELEASKDELKGIFERLPDVFYRTDMQGIITRISPSCFDFLGYRPEEMLGTAMASYYCTPEDRRRVVQAITDGGGKATQVESALKHKDGSTIWVSTTAYISTGSSGKQNYIEGIARNISERKRMEEELLFHSRVDSLTGVYTRRYFIDQSEDAIKVMRRYQRRASLLVADLDYFKRINDQYGHHAGDLALIAFTDVCRQEIRESDILGRLGGEEFVLMLPETPIQQALVLAERIREATAALNVDLGNQKIRITVSIGLVEIGNGERPLEAALRMADLAMYQAKEGGRNRVATHTG